MRRIIVGYDRSPDSEAAARWALDEAARTGAAVEFVHAFDWPTWPPTAAMVPVPAVGPDPAETRAVESAVRDAAAAAARTHPSVATSVTLVHNDAALTFIDRSATAAMIVLGCRGHSAVVGLLGSVSVAVSAHARCPVVVVRGRAAPTAPVVVGVDDSDAAQRALAFATEEAATRDVPLRVVRAWAPVTGLWAQSAIATGTVTDAERRTFDELVAGWRQKHPELAIEAEAVVEHPAAALVRAGRDAQLLVVGCRGRSAVQGMLLGSVSQHLLRHCACTVAVVHDRN